MTKLCKDCRWFEKHFCYTPRGRQQVNHGWRVLGGASTKGHRYDPYYQRSLGLIWARIEGSCGREGRFWEPKITPEEQARQEALQALQQAKSRKDTRAQHYAEEAAKRATVEALRAGV